MSDRARYETAVETFIGLLALVDIGSYDDKGQPLRVGPPGSPGAILDEGRLRSGVEVGYCSKLGDCWMLRASGRGPDTTNEVRGCPKPSERTFRE